MMPSAITMPMPPRVPPKPEDMLERIFCTGSPALIPITSDVNSNARKGLILNLMIISINRMMPPKKIAINMRMSSS